MCLLSHMRKAQCPSILSNSVVPDCICTLTHVVPLFQRTQSNGQTFGQFSFLLLLRGTIDFLSLAEGAAEAQGCI